MPDNEQDNTCIIVWSPSELRITDLAAFSSLLADLYLGVAAPYVTSELYQPGANVATPDLPQVTRLQMASPLVTELIAGSHGIVSLGLLGYLLKHPERIGEFLPGVQRGWYNSRVSAEEARSNLERLSNKSRFNVEGRPIRSFEQAYQRRSRRLGRNRPDAPDERSNRGRRR